MIGPDGSQLGIKPLPEALQLAREQDLDLVEVAGQANPPVVKVMDFGKYKYEEAQRAKESRRKSTNISIKEMKYRPKIGVGDFDTKTRKVSEFLSEGHKVKITIMFRGREVFHPELGAQDPGLDRRARGRGREGGDPRPARRPEHDDGPGPRQASAGRRQARAPGAVRYGAGRRPAGRGTRPGPAGTGGTRPGCCAGRGGTGAGCRTGGVGHRQCTPRTPRMTTMPKMKTSKTAAKRFRKTGTGKLRRLQSMRQHLFEKKPSTRTRRLDGYVAVHPGDAKKIKRLLGER